jgi:hypothetical protein
MNIDGYYIYTYGLLRTFVDKMYFAIDGYLPSCVTVKERSASRLDGSCSSLPANRQ